MTGSISPTWKVGANSWAHGNSKTAGQNPGRRHRRWRTSGIRMAFLLSRRGQPARSRWSNAAGTPSRSSASHWKPCIWTEVATKTEIKFSFKELVKRHHP